MTRLADALRALAQDFAAVSSSPRLDAELLAGHALGLSRSAVVLDGQRLLTAIELETLTALAERRMQAEPIAYILGERDFWTLTLETPPGVLVPRPDSETLVEAALAWAKGHAVRRVLDLGTGSGALLLAVLSELPDALGVGIDRDGLAVAVARRNAARSGLSERVTILEADWTDNPSPLGKEDHAAGMVDGDTAGASPLRQPIGLPPPPKGEDQRFDLILANPPYIATTDTDAMAPETLRHEPRGALFAGPDGLDAYRALIPQLPSWLAPGGAVVLEIGWQQAAAVSAVAQAQGFTATTHQDLGGRDRALLLFFPGNPR
jgi:release factor glutamine methyltransferase